MQFVPHVVFLPVVPESLFRGFCLQNVLYRVTGRQGSHRGVVRCQTSHYVTVRVEQLVDGGLINTTGYTSGVGLHCQGVPEAVLVSPHVLDALVPHRRVDVLLHKRGVNLPPHRIVLGLVSHRRYPSLCHTGSSTCGGLSTFHLTGCLDTIRTYRTGVSGIGL